MPPSVPAKSKRKKWFALLWVPFFFLSPGMLWATDPLIPIDQGLFLFRSAEAETAGFVAIIADPQFYRLQILTASGENLRENLSARSWVETRQGILAAINAGMYQKDYRTSVGLLFTPGHINNPRLNRYNAVLAFDPVRADLPHLQIIDRKCQSIEDLRPRYRTMLQGERMVSCKQVNTWQPGGEQWPIAALATDRDGRILFLFSPKPITPHQFVNDALRFPLRIYNMMYLEGGPPAQLYFKHASTEIDLVGSYTNTQTKTSLPVRTLIPNVLTLSRR